MMMRKTFASASHFFQHGMITWRLPLLEDIVSRYFAIEIFCTPKFLLSISHQYIFPIRHFSVISTMIVSLMSLLDITRDAFEDMRIYIFRIRYSILMRDAKML